MEAWTSHKILVNKVDITTFIKECDWFDYQCEDYNRAGIWWSPALHTCDVASRSLSGRMLRCCQIFICASDGGKYGRREQPTATLKRQQNSQSRAPACQRSARAKDIVKFRRDLTYPDSVFPQTVTVYSGILSEIDHGCFLPTPFKFTVRCTVTWRQVICWSKERFLASCAGFTLSN